MTVDTGFIQVRHPRPHDPVGHRFLVAGLGSGFEADLYYRVRDHEGNQLAEGRTQGGAGAMQDFHTTVDLGRAQPADPSITLEAFWLSPADPDEDPLGPERDKTVIPLTLAPVFYPGFVGWSPHEVKDGDTLSSIARDDFSEDVTAEHIFECNRDILDSPDEIRPEQVLRVPSSL